MLKNIMEKIKVALQSLKPTMLTPKALVIWAGAGLSFLVSAIAASVWVNSSKSNKQKMINKNNAATGKQRIEDPTNRTKNGPLVDTSEKTSERLLLEPLQNLQPVSKIVNTKEIIAEGESGIIPKASGELYTGSQNTSNASNINTSNTVINRNISPTVTAMPVVSSSVKDNSLKAESLLKQNTGILMHSSQVVNSASISKKVGAAATQPSKAIEMKIKESTDSPKAPIAANNSSAIESSEALLQLRAMPRMGALEAPASAELISPQKRGPSTLASEEIINSSANNANADILSLLGAEERNISQDVSIVDLQTLKLDERESSVKSKEEFPTDKLIQLNTEPLLSLASNQSVNPSLGEDKARENLSNIDSKESKETPVTGDIETSHGLTPEQNGKTPLRAAKASNNSSTKKEGEKGKNQPEATRQAPMQTLSTIDGSEGQESKSKKPALTAVKDGVTVAKAAVSGALESLKSKLPTTEKKHQAKETSVRLQQASIRSSPKTTETAKAHPVTKAEEGERKSDEPSIVKTAGSSIMKNSPLPSSSVKEKRSVAFTQDTQDLVSPAFNSIAVQRSADSLSPPKAPPRGTSINSQRAKAVEATSSSEKRPSSLEGQQLEERQAKQVIAVSAEKAKTNSNLELNDSSTATTKVASNHIVTVNQMQGRLKALIERPLENGKDSRAAVKAIQETHAKELQKQIEELKLLIQDIPKTETLNKLEEYNDRLNKFLIDKKLEKYYNTAKANFSLILEGKAIVEPEAPHRSPIYSFITLVCNVRALIKDCKKELWRVLEVDSSLLDKDQALCSAAEEIKSLILEFKDEYQGKGLSEKQNQERSLVALNNLLLKVEEAQSAIFTLDPIKRTQACDKLTQICNKALENLPNLFKSDSIKKEAYEHSIKNVISIAAEIETLMTAPTKDLKQPDDTKAEEQPLITLEELTSSLGTSTGTICSEPWDSKTSKTHLALLNIRPNSLIDQESKTLETNALTLSISERKDELEKAQSKHTGRLDSLSTNMGQVPTALTQASVELVQGKQATRAVA